MIDQRTKVDALKDLGEKVTGTTLNAGENETIVGMIDKITENYTSGGETTSKHTILNFGGVELPFDTTPVELSDNICELMDNVLDAYIEDNAVYPDMMWTDYEMFAIRYIYYELGQPVQFEFSGSGNEIYSVYQGEDDNKWYLSRNE